MQYLLLAYRDEGGWKALSAAKREAFENACLTNEEELRQSGYLLAVLGLQNREDTIIVQVVNGKVILAEDRIPEMSGQPTHIFLIAAKDLNEAVQVAAKMHQARNGFIEIRPALELDRQAD